MFNCFKCRLQKVVGVEFLSQLAHGPVVIHPWSYGCLAKALNQTSKGTNSKIRWKYMGKIEFGLDLVQVSSFVFGCINIPGTVPDAVALAASTGILLERSIQPVLQMERRLLSPFSICLADGGSSASHLTSP